MRMYYMAVMEVIRCAMLLLVCAFTYGTSAKTLLLCGGYMSDTNSNIWNTVVTLAGGRGIAKIGILTAASSQPMKVGCALKALLESYGAEVYWIPIHDGNKGAAMDEEVVKNIKEMTGFFFGGGKQQKYIENLMMTNRQPSPALKQILSMYENGTVVAATSAGAMVMPSVYTVVEGTSYGALKSGALKVGDDISPTDLVYDSIGGFGLISGHIIDSHFHERGRQGRLIRLLSDTKDMVNGTPYGIGIDEDTALLVTYVGTDREMGKVIGKAGVSFIDTSKSSVDRSSTYYRILNVYAHYLTAGDTIDLRNYSMTVSSKKRPIKGNETRDYAQTKNDIFAQVETGQVSEFRKVAESLFNSRYDSVTYGTTVEDDPQFYVIMTEDTNSEGYYEVDGDSTKYSYYSMKLEIRPRPKP